MKLVNILHDEEIPEIIEFFTKYHGYSLVENLSQVQHSLKNVLINYKDCDIIKKIGGVNVYVGSEDKAKDVWFDTTGDVRIVLRDINYWMSLKGLN